MSKKHKSSGQPESGTSFARKDGGFAGAQAIKEVGGEPTANRATFPVLFIAILAAVLFWGDMYLVNHGGELDARVYAPYESVAQLKSFQPTDESGLLRAKGQKINNSYCAACHQADGNGNPSAFIPPLAGSDWVSPKDPSRIIRIVLHGLQGPITVNGKQYGQATMLPWRDALTDEDVAAVLTYVRSAWGNKAEPVSAALVKEIRAATKERASNFTSDELLQIQLKE
jgi:mono/diheme cytochrome c family protein